MAFKTGGRGLAGDVGIEGINDNEQALHRFYSVAVVLTLTTLATMPAHADFLDDVRRTFTTDMPHFFQDNIPCAFGG